MGARRSQAEDGEPQRETANQEAEDDGESNQQVAGHSLHRDNEDADWEARHRDEMDHLDKEPEACHAEAQLIDVVDTRHSLRHRQSCEQQTSALKERIERPDSCGDKGFARRLPIHPHLVLVKLVYRH